MRVFVILSLSSIGIHLILSINKYDIVELDR